MAAKQIVIRRQFSRGWALTYRVQGEAVSQLWADAAVAAGLARYVPECGEG